MNKVVDEGGSSRTVQSLRRDNRSRVLRHVLFGGPTTRAEIGAACGLSVGSVTNVVSGLIEEGLVEDAGSLPSSGGRRSAVLQARAAGAFTIGVDVGEEGVAAELFDLRLNRVDRQFARVDTHVAPSPDSIAPRITDAIRRLWSRHPDRWSSVVGVGMGLPGVVTTDDRGVQVLHAQSRGWPSTPVSEFLDLPGLEGLPLLADNGASTLAAAEGAVGAARGSQRAIVALLGRGVGLGVLEHGQVAGGRGGSATEWGHTKIALDGRPCDCGGRGCVEAYIGGAAVLDRWREAGGVVSGHGWNALGALIDAATSGDVTARQVLDETIAIAGLALGNLVNLYNPDRIVLGGWVGLRLMETHAGEILAAVQHASLRQFAEQFTLQGCAFGGDSVALGAALLPLERLIEAPMAELRTTHARTARHTSKEMS
ncbi:ROK family transcriptional regulator [uncultured Phycicoccus sp.]|uniref:ROK family transcriptional regulator n=1 Tax=uncultured Phycicoccus sp. TaxID=661422 RepID=UPI00261EF953|nr:ROK family transcriptional regulator [uncultured Phycicoccus sp.]